MWVTRVVTFLGLLVLVTLVVRFLAIYTKISSLTTMQLQEQVGGVKTSLILKPNALELWAGTLQSSYSSLSDTNQKRLSVEEIPEGVVCEITPPILSWLFAGNGKSILKCSNDRFKTIVFITVDRRIVDQLSSDGSYFSSSSIYGIGEWPEITYLPPNETNNINKSINTTEILQLRSNALQIWAGELQIQFNSFGNLLDNVKMISRNDIPLGVVCDVSMLNNTDWFWQTKKWKLSCSYDEFHSRVDLLINGNSARGLNDGYINITTPFTVFGTGEWPEVAYERKVLQSGQSTLDSNVPNQNYEQHSINKNLSKETADTVLDSMPFLRANALQFWAAELLRQFNVTGKIIDNTKVMSRRDIPLGVVCNVGEVKSGSPNRETEIWELNCSDGNLRHTKLRVNGNATHGLTGGVYYDVDFPFIVSGAGSWPESAYDYQQNNFIQLPSEANNTYEAIATNPVTVNLTNTTTATVSRDVNIAARYPTVSRRALWVDRIGLIGVLSAILVIIAFLALALVRLFQQQHTTVISPRDPTIKSKVENKTETNFPPSGYQEKQSVQQSKTYPVRLRADIIAEYPFHYYTDEPDYNQSIQLVEDSSQKNIGEFGMRISNRNKEIYPADEYVFAIEVWLFDKVDESNPVTQKKILLSEYFDRSFKRHDSSLRFTPRAGTQFTLETQNFLLDCMIINVSYIEERMKAIFRDLTTEMIVYQKNKKR